MGVSVPGHVPKIQSSSTADTTLEQTHFSLDQSLFVLNLPEQHPA